MTTRRLFKEAAELRVPRRRRRARLVLVEGRKAIADALAAGARLRYALAAEDFEGEPLAALARAGVPVHRAGARAFARAAATETSQGIVAGAEEPEAALDALLAAPGGAPLAVLDRVQDPGNVGTILRTAAALGFRGALLARGTADPFAPKAVRASAATLFRFPIAVAPVALASPAEPAEAAWGGAALAALLERRGFALACAAEGGDPPEAAFARVAPPVALVIGNEGSGIDPAILARARARVWVPLARGVESLNAAAAFAILAYALARPAAGT